MDRLEIVLIGPGRAGMALGLACKNAGHAIVGVLGRRQSLAKAARLQALDVRWGDPLPHADLVVIAVQDDLIASTAERLGRTDAPVVHLSGLSGLDVLAPVGPKVGSFHPLQTLPTPEDGAAALAGAHVAVTTTDDQLRQVLHGLAHSIGAKPFDLDESAKALYHAGAAAGSNFVTAALALSADAFEAAGVPFDVVRPLVETTVAKAFELGPRLALTGPVARGDVGTVVAQRRALAAVSDELERIFVEMASATASVAGTTADFEETLHGHR